MVKKGVIVKAVVFDESSQILLVRRSKTAPRRALEWDFPGGFVDTDDVSFVEACTRELFEEAGLEPVGGSITLSYAESAVENHLHGQRYDMSWLFFSMRPVDTTVRLSYEHDKFLWATIEKAEQLITYDRQLRALAHLRKAKVLEDRHEQK